MVNGVNYESVNGSNGSGARISGQPTSQHVDPEANSQVGCTDPRLDLGQQANPLRAKRRHFFWVIKSPFMNFFQLFFFLAFSLLKSFSLFSFDFKRSVVMLRRWPSYSGGLSGYLLHLSRALNLFSPKIDFFSSESKLKSVNLDSKSRTRDFFFEFSICVFPFWFLLVIF